MRRFASNRSLSGEARVRQIEDYLASLPWGTSEGLTGRADTTGGGQQAVSGGSGGSGGGGVSSLLGDVTGPAGANTVEAIQNTPVDAPAAGDDQQFAQYDNASGTIRWVNVTAPVFPIRTITGNDTATTADGFILVDTTAGNVTLSLPAAASMTGRVLQAKKISTDANVVTLDGSGAETIDDLTTFPFAIPYTTIAVISNGTEWWVI